MEPAWREFEKLVARLEAALGPAGAVVKSPDRIRNRVTGQMREVDASIRYKIGTVPILITVECRKRAATDDDTWIEQLITKKERLGAAKTIAVSSSGFTEPAKKNARLAGIELRNISDLSQDEMLGWLKIKEIQHVVYHRVINGTARLEMHGPPGERGGRLHPDTVKKLEANPGGSEVFVRHSDGQAFSLKQMLDAAVRMGLDIHTGVPHDGSTVHRNVRIKIPEHLFFILCERGPRDVALISVGVDVHATVHIAPLPEHGFEYSGPDSETVYGIQASAELFGESVVVSFFKEQNSNTLCVTLSRRLGGPGRVAQVP